MNEQEPRLKDYITLAAPAEIRLEIKKSIFIGRAVPVGSESEVEAALLACRKEYPDATHHVFAWRIGSDGRSYLQRYTDDGEPKGTAGLPVLDVLSKGDITDALLIAVRYYGGILLGTGGLVRAYSKTAGAAVRAAGLLRMSQRALYTLHLPYNVYESFVHWCGRREIAVTDTTFAADVGLQLAFSPDLVDVFLEGVADFTGGTCVPDYIGREYIGLPLDREPVTEESTEDEYNP